MKPIEDNIRSNFILGDCLSVLKEMDRESIDCVVTSPPYWGMRAYDNEESEFEIGNESTFAQYVDALMAVFVEVKRVLKKDGSLWLNLGDKYVDKRLIGMPWRVAIALMDRGWIMRNDVIWHQLKGTQSCKDRLRDSYEHIFHFVKSKKYYYDADAIRIQPSRMPIIAEGKTTSSTGVSGKKYRRLIRESSELTAQEKINAEKALDEVLAKELVNRGYYIMRMSAKGHLPSDVWNIVTEDTWRTDTHCAVYPEELLRIPILATCKKNGIVLDPFSGTGTTVSAAIKLGRRGVGIELSPEYHRSAQQRIAQTANRHLQP